MELFCPLCAHGPWLFMLAATKPTGFGTMVYFQYLSIVSDLGGGGGGVGGSCWGHRERQGSRDPLFWSHKNHQQMIKNHQTSRKIKEVTQFLSLACCTRMYSCHIWAYLILHGCSPSNPWSNRLMTKWSVHNCAICCVSLSICGSALRNWSMRFNESVWHVVLDSFGRFRCRRKPQELFEAVEKRLRETDSSCDGQDLHTAQRAAKRKNMGSIPKTRSIPE